MDAEFVKYIASLGVGGVIAMLIYNFSQKALAAQTKGYEEKLTFFIDQWKGQAEVLLQVVKENSAAITANTQTVASLHQRMSEDRTYIDALRNELAPILRQSGFRHHRADDDKKT
jgi:hypothetical protein